MATWLYSKLLAKEGFQITVITKQFQGEASFELSYHGLQIYRLPLKMKLGNRYDTFVNIGVLGSTLIRRLLSETDVVYVPGNWYSVTPIAKLFGRPVVVHLHNYSLACPSSLMYDFSKNKVGRCSQKSFVLHEMLERKRGSTSIVASCFLNELVGKSHNKMGTLGDALIFVSKAQRDLVLSQVPHLRTNSYVILNPIPDIPLTLNKCKGVGYFGGKDFVKGAHILTRALKSVRHSKGVEAYLGMMAPQERVVNLTNGLRVKLLPKIDISTIMPKISIVAVPSLCPEPSPYALVESMLYCKLVIASNIGGIAEILAGSSSGVALINPGNFSEIADSIDCFLALSLDEMNELGLRNRKHVLAKFANNQSASSLAAIFENVAKQ